MTDKSLARERAERTKLIKVLHKLVAFQCEVVRSNGGQICEYEELPEPMALLRKLGIKDPTRFVRAR